MMREVRLVRFSSKEHTRQYKLGTVKMKGGSTRCTNLHTQEYPRSVDSLLLLIIVTL